jgi:2-haloacid dehalogenase
VQAASRWVGVAGTGGAQQTVLRLDAGVNRGATAFRARADPGASASLPCPVKLGIMPARSLTGVEACVFDAYGTLFDVGSVARGAQGELADRCQALSDLWRSKQLQYTWLRALTGHHADFWQVTGDALDYAMSSLGLDDAGLRERLMNLYLRILAYPEVPTVLERLKSGGMKLAILSNGTPHMLAAALANAGIAGYFDAVLSVEEAGVFKPHPRVYGLAPRRLGVRKQAICFLSSNGWDAWSAKAYGFQVLWCNRNRQAAERIPAQPDGELQDLCALPSLVLRA